jgi:dTDP-4-dehydro-6-deoxy-alpha-D-glucopyranose 2,3-dehydratase
VRTVQPGRKSAFLKSALTEANKFHTTEEVLLWLRSTPAERRQSVHKIRFDALREWSFQEESGDLVHRSGKFFRVTGIRVTTDLGPRSQWEQPIIDQPEIGILGILAREIDGVLHLLMQAKMEPGNPLGVQLTPTVQATHSNYTQVHQGARPLYLDHFLERDHARVLVDQLQWEHGSAFLRKRNRNMVIQVNDGIPLEQGFRWLTLGQVKKLLGQPNLVSMDTRTVIACMALIDSRANDSLDSIDRNQSSDFAGAALDSFASPEAASTDEEVMGWLNDLKCRCHLSIQHLGLSELSGWERTDREIRLAGSGYFKIVAVDVESASREVPHWTQPMIAADEQGLVAFLVTEIHGVLHALIKARVEPGSADTVTLGPTVQSALGCQGSGRDDQHSVLFDLVRNATSANIRFSCVQSEEGGRFYQVRSEYRIVEVGGGHQLTLPPEYMWLSFRQLQEMVRYGLLSVEARSLLSCLSFT